MARKGYTNLSIEAKRYDQLRRQFDMKVKTDQTFSEWAMTTLEDAVEREVLLGKMFSNMYFVGKRAGGGIVVEDGNELIDVTISRNSMKCNKHNTSFCQHCLFASMHYNFIG